MLLLLLGAVAVPVIAVVVLYDRFLTKKNFYNFQVFIRIVGILCIETVPVLYAADGSVRIVGIGGKPFAAVPHLL